MTISRSCAETAAAGTTAATGSGEVSLPTLVLLFAILLAGAGGLALLWWVHLALENTCVRYAERHCRKRGLKVSRSRHGPQLVSGIKTECTLVELECLDSLERRRLVRLSVWVFGVHAVLGDEEYPVSYDKEWPRSAPSQPLRK